MNDRETAFENLQVIRSLMERATVYRAISGPGAILGGCLALIAGGWGMMQEADPAPSVFVIIWLLCLALISSANFWLLAREAKDRDEPFFSAGMKTALVTILPTLAVGGAIGLWQALKLGSTGACAASWILFFGLALLASSGFAPRSLRILGAVFTIAGVLLATVLGSILERPDAGSLLMGTTFGLLNLVYGIAVLIRGRLRRPEPEPAA